MTLGEKIADSLPDPVIEFVQDHPRVIYLLTVPLVLWATWNLERAYRLQMAAEGFVRQQVSGAARAASEALGG